MVLKEEVEAKLENLWKKLLAQEPSNEDLWYIIKHVKPLREEAGERLLKQGPSVEDLRYIIEHVETLREEAKRLLERDQTASKIIGEMERIISA